MSRALSHTATLTPARGDTRAQRKNGLTRRSFLERVVIAGGSAAIYESMTALGLINLPEAWAGPPELPQGSGAGKSIVILGAGIGGLTAADLSPLLGDCDLSQPQFGARKLHRAVPGQKWRQAGSPARQPRWGAHVAAPQGDRFFKVTHHPPA